MIKIIIFLCFTWLIGCSPAPNKHLAPGPLAQMKEFQVIPYADVDQAFFFTEIAESLKQVGSVHIVDTCEELFNSKNSAPALLISIQGDQPDLRGSIRLFGEVLIQPNQHKVVSQIWSIDDQSRDLPYPVIENDQVVFRKNEISNNSQDTHSVVRRMIAQFSEEYHKDNPIDTRPVFYLYSPKI